MKTNRQYLEIMRPGEQFPGPYLMDMTGKDQEYIDQHIAAIREPGVTVTLKHGTPPDMEGRE